MGRTASDSQSSHTVYLQDECCDVQKHSTILSESPHAMTTAEVSRAPAAGILTLEAEHACKAEAKAMLTPIRDTDDS